jgi:hypothetical protein
MTEVQVERRSGRERRSGEERRLSIDRRFRHVPDGANGEDRSVRAGWRIIDLRSGEDRRSGKDRRKRSGRNKSLTVRFIHQ